MYQQQAPTPGVLEDSLDGEPYPEQQRNVAQGDWDTRCPYKGSYWQFVALGEQYGED